MNGFLKILWRVAQYRAARWLLTLALLAVASFVGMSKAQAQDFSNCLSTTHASAACESRQDAYEASRAYVEAKLTAQDKSTYPSLCTALASANTYVSKRFISGCEGFNNANWGTRTFVGCPNGEAWNDVDKVCGEPHDPAQCLAKNDALSSAIQTTAPSTNGCHEGCATSMGTDYVRTYVVVNGMEATAFRGQARFTGAACTTPTKPPEDQEPECMAIEGQTVCKRAKDGKLCAKSASTSEYFCWGPGETGTKASGPDSQVRQPGNDPAPPPPVLLPNGDTSNPVGNPITTNETKPGVPGTPATNTTINNFTTVNGTSPAPDGGAGPGDGEGGPTGPGEGTDGDGEEGDKGTVTGGDTCGSAPVITGGDPLVAAGIMQTWRMRCEGKDDAAKTAFDATVAAGLLNAGENAPEGFSSGASGDWGGATGTWADGDDPFAGARIEEDESDLLGKLKEDSWFGTGGQCPVLPSLNVGAISLPLQIQAICDLLSALSGVILAVAYLRAFRIMAGS